jgi:hypothetical protein
MAFKKELENVKDLRAGISRKGGGKMPWFILGGNGE